MDLELKRMVGTWDLAVKYVRIVTSTRRYLQGSVDVEDFTEHLFCSIGGEVARVLGLKGGMSMGVAGARAQPFHSWSRLFGERSTQCCGRLPPELG